MGSRSHDELVAHVVWAVKDRRPLLHEADDGRRLELFRLKAADVGATLLAGGCGPDHVHVLLRFPAAKALSEVVGRLKGASARVHNLEAPADAFAWQDGFWAQSCTPRDLAAVTAYIQTQRQHHRSQLAPEVWERHPTP